MNVHSEAWSGAAIDTQAPPSVLVWGGRKPALDEDESAKCTEPVRMPTATKWSPADRAALSGPVRSLTKEEIARFHPQRRLGR